LVDTGWGWLELGDVGWGMLELARASNKFLNPKQNYNPQFNLVASILNVYEIELK